MQVESCATPLLTIDEVEKVQRQKITSFIGCVFQLTYAATVVLFNTQVQNQHSFFFFFFFFFNNIYWLQHF